MSFASATTLFDRLVAAQDVNKVRRTGLLALSVANPSVGSVAVLANTLASGTDGSLWWGGTGAAWAQVGGGAFPMSFADDVFITFGTDDDYLIGFSAAANGIVISGTPMTAAGGGAAKPTIVIASPVVTTSSAGGGVDSGVVEIGSGNTDAAAGATGGNTGAVRLRSGAANSTAGTSGDSGIVGVGSGDSADGDAGDVTVYTGNAAAGTAGNLYLSPGNGQTTSGVVIPTRTVVNASGVLPSSDAQAALPSVKEFTVAGAGALTWSYNRNGEGGTGKVIDAWFVKTDAPGAAGDTITLATTTGTLAVFDLDSVAVGTVVRLGAAEAPFTGSANAGLADGDDVTATAAQASNAAGILYVSIV